MLHVPARDSIRKDSPSSLEVVFAVSDEDLEISKKSPIEVYT